MASAAAPRRPPSTRATWRNDPVYDVGIQPCVVTGPGTARCDFGTVPDTSATTASADRHAHVPGHPGARVEVATASNDPDLTNNVATTSLEVFKPVTIDVAPGDSHQHRQPESRRQPRDRHPDDGGLRCGDGGREHAVLRRCRRAGRTGVRRAARGRTPQDVDRDGDRDLLLHYLVSEVGIDSGDSRACVKGRTVSGTGVFGCDAVAPQLNRTHRSSMAPRSTATAFTN